MTFAQLVALVIFLLFSTLFGMFGVGGGAVYTPIQLFIGVSFNEAATVSLFLIAVTSLSSGVVYVRAGLIDWLAGYSRRVPAPAAMVAPGVSAGCCCRRAGSWWAS